MFSFTSKETSTSTAKMHENAYSTSQRNTVSSSLPGAHNEPLVSAPPPASVTFGYVPPPPPPTPTSPPRLPPNPNYDHPYSAIPPGWSTAVDPQDGRIYYWELATGQRSWTHPLAPPPPPSSSNLPVSIRTRGGPGGGGNSRGGGYYMNHATIMEHDFLAHANDEHPRFAHRRPDNHQCSAVAAVVLCFPLGILALYHSWQTDVAWKGGRYGDSVVHARQAPQYASWGIAIGSIFWMLWFFFRRGNDQWMWPDWSQLFHD
ncbi:hypothetical protein ACA910_010805 [Epithemia clementina (nom. ined.)]